MATDTTLVQVEIFGQTYKLRADGDAEYVESLAAYVDGKMREVSTQTRAVDSLKVAILAALNIADEQHRARRASGVVSATRGAASVADAAAIEKRAADWVRILDEAMAG
jgi:cell division protein ZapA